MKKLIRLAASFFYVGYLPKAPGTFGSLAGALLAWSFYPVLPFLFLALCLVGFAVCKPSREVFAAEDPQVFVLDEVCGMMLAVLWLPKTLPIFIGGFLLFRALDILKPWPISRIEKFKSPLTILWDDLAAGILANFVLQMICFSAPSLKVLNI